MRKVVQTHRLKTITYHFGKLWDRKKTAELRFNDRKFKVGDYLQLYWHEQNSCVCIYKNCYIVARITEITEFPEALKPGWVMLSLGDMMNCKEYPHRGCENR